MITYDEAFRIMLTDARPVGTERVVFTEALNRVLAEDIASDIDMPPFNKSAMDGYACRRQDIANPLKVIEEIPAGSCPKRTIGKNECSKIMTGAPVPEGADIVVKVEDVAQIADDVIRVNRKSGASPSLGRPPSDLVSLEAKFMLRPRKVAGSSNSEMRPRKSSSSNICLRGEDVKSGSIVLGKGELVTPAHIAILASVGCVNPLVSKKPRVVLIATGDEIVEPGSNPGGAGIRNSNSYQLCAQINNAGALAEYFGIVADKRDDLTNAVQKVAAKCDVIMLSGGVSAGDYDFVPEVLKKCGFDIRFESVAMQPGKPTVFGQNASNVFCIGLPGNPVSTFVVFEMLVKPFLYRMMNYEYKPRIVSAVLDAGISREKIQRQSTVPVKFICPEKVVPLDYHGSAHIHAMCHADGLVTIPEGVAGFTKGSIVHVRSL